MSRQFIYDTRDLVDAGAFNKNVLATCPCGHWAILDSINLWGWFAKRGWDDRIGYIAQHLCCMPCFRAGRPKQLPRIELVQKEPTVKLPWVDDRQFRKVVDRRR